MICSSRPAPSARLPASSVRTSPQAAARPAARPSVGYGPVFWRTYAANTVMMVAFALLYRFADFVTVLGGSEIHLGWIVGVGTVGSLATRLFLGTAIDRQGPRQVWLGSTILFAICCFAHLGIGSCHGPAIYLLRIAWCSALAGFFGASTTFIAVGAAEIKVAEMVGMLGTSGFVGTVLGSALGDALFPGEGIQRYQVDRMFIGAGLLGLASMLFVWLATRSDPPRRRRRRPPLLWIVRRYHPGAVLAVGVASGIGLALPQTFLRSYAIELNIASIGVFFSVYAPAAIVTRVVSRRWPERFGVMPMLALGTGGLVVSVLLFLAVRSQWQLVIPGLTFGFAHALIFPSVVAAGTRTFPHRHRGVGTTLTLASWDIGSLVGAPIAGLVLHYSEPLGVPGYPTMFLVIAGLMGSISLAALVGHYRRSRQDERQERGRSALPRRSAVPGHAHFAKIGKSAQARAQ